MACHSKPGPAAFRAFIHETLDQSISQKEWHTIRDLAAADSGGRLSRARVDHERVEAAASALTNATDFEGGYPLGTNRDVSDFTESEKRLFTSLEECHNTEGTVATVEYLAKHGVEDTLEKIRGEAKKADKAAACSRCGGEVDDLGDRGFCEDCLMNVCSECDADLDDGEGWNGLCGNCADRAYAAKHPEDDNAAEADLADADRIFSERVAVFEAAGMPTSDAIAAVEAEDLIRAKKVDGMSEQERQYADRVYALELELGISTSDAQGMIDAEDMLAARKAK